MPRTLATAPANMDLCGNTSPQFLGLIGHLLEQHHVTQAEWRSVDPSPKCVFARQAVAHHLHGLGWSQPRISAHVGVSVSSVRRYLDRDPALLAERSAAARALPVVQTKKQIGPTMVNKPGERRDCQLDAQCLRTLLKQYDPHAPPRYASCPRNCTFYVAPDLDQRRYDAGRRPGGAPDPS